MIILAYDYALLLTLFTGHTQAKDGCGLDPMSWRCGDSCIGWGAKCSCNGSTFGDQDPKWCCQSSLCQGIGEWHEKDMYWRGETNKEGIRIGANCNGTVLSLKEPCQNSCNFYPEDVTRNFNALRSYPPCTPTIPGKKITQCIPEGAKEDGKYDCANRVDENPFKSDKDNSPIHIDISSILQPCAASKDEQGYKCTGAPIADDCLHRYMWCDPLFTYTCSELNMTRTQKTTDPQICSDQIFWENQNCKREGYRYRCTGKTPGDCWGGGDPRCNDGSHVIAQPKEGLLHCGEELKCVGRGGKWRGYEVCIKERNKCDGIVQCLGQSCKMSKKNTQSKFF